MKDKRKLCPRCGEKYTGYPSLSRVDNETDICPECGLIEAMSPIHSLKTQKLFLRATEILKGINKQEKQSLKDFQQQVRSVKRKLREKTRRRS